MDVKPLELLWVGFRTLRDLEHGCLGRKRVSVTTVGSFGGALDVLSHQRVDIVVLSLSGSGRKLVEQIERTRALSDGALIAVVVCNEEDAEHARSVGADDVMSLENEGELVCAPVLRWVDMRRRGNTDLIDLRAATRRRRGLEAEIQHLNADVASLSRQAVYDPASKVLGRTAFILQIELAAELLGRGGSELRLFVYDIDDIDAGSGEWGDFVLGGIATRIGQAIGEIAGARSIVGRITPTRFAVALTDASDDDANWLADAIRDRLGDLTAPSGASLSVLMCGGRLGTQPALRPGQRLLERVEKQLDRDLTQTRVYRQAGA